MNEKIFRSLIAYAMQNPPEIIVDRLPPEYQEVLYVTNEGSNAYIDTGLKADFNDEYIVTAFTAATGNRPIFGDSNSRTDSNICLWVNRANQECTFNFGNGQDAANYVLTVPGDFTGFVTYRMIVATGQGWVNGEYAGQSKRVQNFNNAKKLVFFASWRGNKIFDYWHSAISEYIIIRNGVKIRHYIPCYRKSDNIVGMYDLCESICSKTNTPFYVSGNGDKLFIPTQQTTKPNRNAGIQFEIEVNNINEQKTIQCETAVPIYFVDWGDGIVNNEVTHVYSLPGRYLIKINSEVFYQNREDYLQISNMNVKRIHKLNIEKISKKFIQNNTEVTIANDALKEGLTEIRAGAFYQCRSIDIGSLPNSVKIIGDNAFAGTAISISQLPPNLTTIGGDAFNGCSNIAISQLPNTLTTLGNRSFYGCPLVTISSVPTKITVINNYTFQNCSGITSFTVHNKVTRIGIDAFNGCINLQSITIPSSVKTIDNSAFKRCYMLTYLFLDGVTTIGTEILRYSGIETLEINSSNYVTATNNSFYGCTELANCYINAPNLTSIPNQFFYGCTSLVSLYLNTPSITSVGTNAFPTSLRDLYVPFSQGDVDLSGLSENITVHYDYSFPATTPGHFFD